MAILRTDRNVQHAARKGDEILRDSALGLPQLEVFLLPSFGKTWSNAASLFAFWSTKLYVPWATASSRPWKYM